MFAPAPFAAHALLDSGSGEKLERFGPVLLRRPEPQALWRPRLDGDAWDRAHLRFERESDRGGRWRSGPAAPAEARGREPAWQVELPSNASPARVWIRPTPFKHVGLFPEQAVNWGRIERLAPRFREHGEARLLNLFGYTGAASVLAALAGYRVTHVDASRLALDACRQNAELNPLPEGSLRLLLEDALAFARREARRGTRYQVVLLDPPHYGRGPKGQKWQLEEHLVELLEAVAELLAERSLVVLSTYAVGHSPLAFENLLAEFPGGEVRAGELALEEEPRAGLRARRLSQGFCALWWRGLDGAEVLG